MLRPKARDLRTAIKEQGFERGVVSILEQMLDEQTEVRQHLRELTTLVSQCIDQIDRFVSIGDGMKRELETIKRERTQHEDGDTC